MAITRRPPAATKPVNDAAADAFINGAPDAAPAKPAPAAAPASARSNVVRGKQLQVTFALPAELLVKVDDAADGLSISRAAFIKQALTRAVQAEAA